MLWGLSCDIIKVLNSAGGSSLEEVPESGVATGVSTACDFECRFRNAPADPRVIAVWAEVCAHAKVVRGANRSSLLEDDRCALGLS